MAISPFIYYIIVFLPASYFIFSASWGETLGRQTGKHTKRLQLKIGKGGRWKCIGYEEGGEGGVEWNPASRCHQPGSYHTCFDAIKSCSERFTVLQTSKLMIVRHLILLFPYAVDSTLWLHSFERELSAKQMNEEAKTAKKNYGVWFNLRWCWGI